MSDTAMTQKNQAYQATPSVDLETQIMSSTVPKNEREWWAHHTIAALREELAQAKKQLPEGMQSCTILFKECPKGHGELTATNWVQHECLVCRLAQAQARIAELEGTHTCTWSQNEDENCWESSCSNELFTLNEGGPTENRMRHCCYCGGTLVEGKP